MSWLSKAIDAGGDNRYGLDDIEDSLFLTAGNRYAKTSQFWMLLVLASVIAAGGVVSDSTPAVIGAMIVAPLTTTFYGAPATADAVKFVSAAPLPLARLVSAALPPCHGGFVMLPAGQLVGVAPPSWDMGSALVGSTPVKYPLWYAFVQTLLPM